MSHFHRFCICMKSFFFNSDPSIGETSYPMWCMFSEQIILLLYCIGHQFFLCTFRTNYIFCISYESFSYHGCFTRRANKTVVVPMSSFKGYESSTSNTYRVVHQNVTIVYIYGLVETIIISIECKSISRLCNKISANPSDKLIQSIRHAVSIF